MTSPTTAEGAPAVGQTPVDSWIVRERREREWLAGLKVGDAVAVSTRWHGYRMDRVTKLTATQIVTTTGRYRRQNGWPVGSAESSIKEPTQEIRDDIEKRTLTSYVARYPFDKLSLDTLRSVVAAIKADVAQVQA